MAADAAGATHAGWLQMRGGALRRWQNRYFALFPPGAFGELNRVLDPAKCVSDARRAQTRRRCASRRCPATPRGRACCPWTACQRGRCRSATVTRAQPASVRLPLPHRAPAQRAPLTRPPTRHGADIHRQGKTYVLAASSEGTGCPPAVALTVRDPLTACPPRAQPRCSAGWPALPTVRGYLLRRALGCSAFPVHTR